MDKKKNVPVQDSDFMFEPVSMKNRRSTFRQIMVWVGFGYVVTGLFVGGSLAGTATQGMSFANMLISIIIGQGTLVLLATVLGIIAQKTGMGLALLSKFSYGKKGFILPLIIMGLLTLGWFSSITGMGGSIWGDFLGNSSGITVFSAQDFGFDKNISISLEVFLACFIFGIIVTITSVWGIKGLEAIAVPVSPVICVVAIIIGGTLLGKIGGVQGLFSETASREGLNVSTAITMVIGSWIAGVIMGTELFRFNKNKLAVFFGAVACFVFTNPLLNIVGYLGAVTVGQFNYMSWLISLNVLLGIVGVISWTLSLWTTNDAELYCHSMYLGPVITESTNITVNKKVLIGTVGIIGTILGSFGFYQLFFAEFINILGVMAPPIIGPILIDFYITKKQQYRFQEIKTLSDLNHAGIFSFLIAAILGLGLFLGDVDIPFPIGIISLLTAMAVYFVWTSVLKPNRR